MVKMNQIKVNKMDIIGKNVFLLLVILFIEVAVQFGPQSVQNSNDSGSLDVGMALPILPQVASVSHSTAKKSKILADKHFHSDSNSC